MQIVILIYEQSSSPLLLLSLSLSSSIVGDCQQGPTSSSTYTPSRAPFPPIQWKYGTEDFSISTSSTTDETITECVTPQPPTPFKSLPLTAAREGGSPQIIKLISLWQNPLQYTFCRLLLDLVVVVVMAQSCWLWGISLGFVFKCLYAW